MSVDHNPLLRVWPTVTGIIVLCAGMTTLAAVPGAAEENHEVGIGSFTPATQAAVQRQGPIQVGEEFPTFLATPHPVPPTEAGGVAWYEVIHHPGASYIAVHFSQFDLGPGDKVVIRTPDRFREYEFTGEGRPGLGGTFWATYVPGDTCEVILISGGQSESFGFVIDRYAAGYPEPKEDPEDIEAICGVDDSQWAPCYTTSEPTVYQRSRAVARLLIAGGSACTGWLVGNGDYLITNNHCISTQSSAANTNYEFMAEGATCSTSCQNWGACPGTVVNVTATLIKTNYPNDYSLIKLTPNSGQPSPSATYGYLQLRPDGAVVGERMYIPQHPAAWGKKVAVYSTHSSDPDGFATVFSVTRPACMSGGPPDVGYYADTQGGSSGSPVLGYSDHKVIALHHCANCPNRGVPIQEVISHLGADLPPGAVEDAPFLQVANSSFVDTCPGLGPGHEDDIIDPGEFVDLTFTLLNSGNLAATGVVMTIATDSPNVTVAYGTAAFPDINPGASADNADPLMLLVHPDAPCGAQVVLEITVVAGDRTWEDVLTLTVGNPGSPDPWLENGCAFTPCASVGEHLVLVNRTGTGDGTVTSNPAGINCGSTCYAMFDEGIQVVLSAETPAGNTFDGWSGDCSGTAPCVLTMDQSKLITATFTRITHQLTVLKAGTGAGTVTSSPAGIDCGSSCAATYDFGTVVNLAPSSSPGSFFVGWSGACTGTGMCTVTMDQARTVTATFNANTHTLTVSKAGTGDGTVTSDPAGINCGGACAAPFAEGTVVFLSQTADTGSEFSGWSGACTGTGSCMVVMTMARSVTATFTRKEVSPLVGAAVHLDPEAGATSNGNLILEPGETVVFHPAWHNPGLQGRAATGVAAPADGPGGDFIQVLDDTADYGTILGGEIRDSREQTGNSYLLHLPAPAQRPSTLWRVEVTETLSTGDVHTWRIHVGDSFVDVGVDHWAYQFIETLLHSEITSGCSPTEYCPGATVTRWQMAVFLAKAMIGDENLLPDSGTVPGLGGYVCGAGGVSVFGDIPPTDPACRHIHHIAAQEVTVGCGGGLYCPAELVNRWQMAVFLAKAVVGDEALLPTAGTVPNMGAFSCGIGGVSVFSDIPAEDPACRHIHFMAAEGITAGCGGGLYCPAHHLQRDQMAVFLVKAFGLSLE